MKINKILLKNLKEISPEDPLKYVPILLHIYFFPKEEIPSSLSSEALLETMQYGFVKVCPKTGGYNLTFPLFEDAENESKMEWVKDFRNLFKEVNTDRAGTLKTCYERMKVFLRENPEVRADEILEATKMYLASTSPNYIMKSHKFIYDGSGVFRNSTLEEWIEKYKEQKEFISNSKASKDITDKMQ